MVLILDTENDTYNKGSPFDQRFNPVCIGWKHGQDEGVIWQGQRVTELAERIAESEAVVGFNLKYDLHVLRHWRIPCDIHRVWCCQVAEYLLDRQSRAYPSLEGTSQKYGLGGKLDRVAEYWAKGIQTSEIPRDELAEYVLQDVALTHQIYLKQQQQIK